MANEEHLAILRQGVEAWNRWREENPDIEPDLREADLSQAKLNFANLSAVDLRGANLTWADFILADLHQVNLSEAELQEAGFTGANLRHANLSGADLSGARLHWANFSGANLSEANLEGAKLGRAVLHGADLSQGNLNGADLDRADLSDARLFEVDLGGADLDRANFSGADLSWASLLGVDLHEANLTKATLYAVNLTRAYLHRANLSGADLQGASLIEADLSESILSNCRVYGVSAWEVDLTGAEQKNLIVTPPDQPAISVDNLEVAQFIYLLLNNQRIRDIINTISTKVVLILGRFTPKRQAVLDAMHDELRNYDYVPIVFDFDKPATRDTHETITTLARLARFVIADITNPKSIPQELVSIVESLPSVPVQPLLQGKRRPWGMYDHIRRYPWVLPLHRYDGLEDLLASLEKQVIGPAEAKAKEQQPG